MTRFAGSAVDFTPASLQSASSGGGYSSAADAVSLGANFQAQREKAPKYDQLAGAGMEARSREKQAAMQAASDVTAAGIGAVAQTKGAAIQAEGQLAAAKAQADSQKQSGFMSGLAGIASAGLGLLSPI